MAFIPTGENIGRFYCLDSADAAPVLPSPRIHGVLPVSTSMVHVGV